MRIKRSLIGLGLFLLSITWCALQTMIGFLICLVLLPFSRLQNYRGMIVLYHPFSFTFSVGTFAVVSNGTAVPREICGKMYGHYVQSLLYGPFYLFAVAIPQLIVRIPFIRIHREERGLYPEDLYTDRQAAMLQARFGE